MNLALLENKIIKVVLTSSDMIDYDLTYTEMDYSNQQTKQILSHLIDKIKNEFSMDLKLSKLLIEAFPYQDGGCILYINSVQPTKSSTMHTPIIYEFDNITVLSSAVKQLYSQYTHIIIKSELYLYNEKYILIIYTYFKMDKQIYNLLNEYADFYGKGVIVSAVIKEHAKKLISDNAVETLLKCI